jgi:hypothetical protein
MSQVGHPTTFTIAGGDGCNTGRVGNQGWSDNIGEHDVGQNIGSTPTGHVYTEHSSGEAANAFLAQAVHVERSPDSSVNPLGEHTSAYDVSDNAVTEHAVRQERS